MMEQVGQHVHLLNTGLIAGIRRCRNSNSSFSFWRTDYPVTAATEEYDGTSWTSNPQGLNTARSN
jgi:hypothetical protein